MIDTEYDAPKRLAQWRRVEWAARRAGIDGLSALGNFCRSHAITLTDPATNEELEYLIQALSKNRKPKSRRRPVGQVLMGRKELELLTNRLLTNRKLKPKNQNQP